MQELMNEVYRAANECKEDDIMQVGGLVVFSLVEVHWIREALNAQISKERGMYELLRVTEHLAEDVDFHRLQLASQLEILEGYELLLTKILTCKPLN
ncbi:MAG: hypothetical protein ACYCX4_02950 [Bacillota bacterium]